MKATVYLILFALISLSACKTNMVYINTTNPSPVTISSSTKNVGIINRSIPVDDNKTLNTIHQNSAGETLQLIKDASTECMKGLNDALAQNKRFDTIKLLNAVDLKTPVIGTFPSHLMWNDVESICNKYGVDILFSLEIFDTQLKVVPITNTPKINSVMDVINTVAQAQVNITTTVKTGWRIYDPKNKYILDEYPMVDNLSVTANAATILNTTEALLGRKEAIKQSSNRMGRDYSNRIIPYWVTLRREYYVKGNYNFKIATRKARTRNWDGAGELWLQETKSSKRKIAGRACYNMAILSEINGDIDKAMEWAQKAYENYNNKLALQYVNMLRYRKQSNQRLNYQLGN
jgi:ribosomal protein L39E